MRHALWKLATLLVMLTSAAAAGDEAGKGDRACTAAHDTFERTICSDANAKAEDARMSATYFETMHRLDAAHKTALLSSQRLWLRTQRTSAFNDDPDMYEPVDEVIQALIQRTNAIIATFPVEGYAGEPDLRHQHDRHPPSFDAAKPFEGTWPAFVRYRGSEREVPELFFQTGLRVCGFRSEWFSGHVGRIGVIATAHANKATIRYICALDDTGEECALMKDDGPVWKPVRDTILSRCGGTITEGSASACAPPSKPEFGYTDEDLVERPAWIAKCLAEDSYPPPAAIVKQQ